MDTAQAEGSDGRSSLFTIPVLSFPPTAFPQGLEKVKLKKLSPLPVAGFQPCSIWLTTAQHLLFTVSFILLFRDLVAPRLHNAMSSAHKPRHSKGPIRQVADRTGETSNRGIWAAAASPQRTPQPRLGGEARRTAINITFSQRCKEKGLGPLQTSTFGLLLWPFCREARGPYRQHGFLFHHSQTTDQVSQPGKTGTVKQQHSGQQKGCG